MKETKTTYIRYALALLLMLFLSSLMLGASPTEVLAGFTSTPEVTPTPMAMPTMTPMPTPTEDAPEEPWDTPTPAPTPTPTPDKLLPEAGEAPRAHRATSGWLIVVGMAMILGGVVLRQMFSRAKT